MNNLLFLIVIGILIIFAIRFGRNLFRKKIDNCHNCGQSIYKKSSLYFDSTENKKKEINLCENCLGNPQNIDQDHIVGNLKKKGWNKEDILNAYKVIGKYKEFYKASPS